MYAAGMEVNDKWLNSDETGEAFTHCVRCRMPLWEIDGQWLVNKEFHRGECVLEYAICQHCRDEVTDQLSEESRDWVRGFLEREIDWEERVKDFMLTYDLDERFRLCISCRAPRGEVEGYGISALFGEDGRLMQGALPLMICRGCIGRMTEGVSEESRAVWRRFLEECFSGPPDGSGFPGLL